LPAHERDLADLALLTEAAIAAGSLTLRYFRRDPEHWSKYGGSPVSEADHASDALLREMLMGARPGYGWLSEESEDDLNRLNRSRVFIVDPIDGTRAFLRGEPAYGVSVAVVEDGLPVAGVVHMPARGETYAAALGGGATFERQAVEHPVANEFDPPEPLVIAKGSIQVSERKQIDGSKTLITRPNLNPDLWRRTPPQVAPSHRPSLAWRLCLVAKGRVDALVTLRGTFDWDVAAGALMVSEAGGVSRTRTGEAPVFNTPDAHLPGFISGPKALVDDVLSRL